MPTEEEFFQKLRFDTYQELGSRQRTYIVTCIVLWVLSISISRAPVPPPETIDPAFVTQIIQRERTYTELKNKRGSFFDIFLTDFPKDLAKELCKQVQPLQAKLNDMVKKTDFSKIQVPNLVGQSNNLTNEDAERINRIEYVLEQKEKDLSQEDREALPFYKMHLLELETGPAKIGSPTDKMIDGIALRLENETLSYKDLINRAVHQNDNLKEIYKEESGELQQRKLPFVEVDLRRSWIVWLLPIVLAVFMRRAYQLRKIRSRILRDALAEFDDPAYRERISPFIKRDNNSLKKSVLGGSHAWETLNSSSVSIGLWILPFLMMLTPILNLFIDMALNKPPSNIGYGPDPLIYLAVLLLSILGFVLLGGYKLLRFIYKNRQRWAGWIKTEYLRAKNFVRGRRRNLEQ